MTWTLIPSLAALRGEFNAAYPDRDRTSDGSIGDAAHAAGTSDHNVDDGPDQGHTPYEDDDGKPEVHAIDVDNGLKSGDPDAMERRVQAILTRCRSGVEDRLHNIIYMRRIWQQKNGWKQEKYTGSNPHDRHAHFSGCYETARENDTSSWGIVEEVYVAAEQDMITITADTAEEIGAKAGDEKSLATLVQLTLIYAARADDKAKAATAEAAAATAAVAKLQADFDAWQETP